MIITKKNFEKKIEARAWEIHRAETAMERLCRLEATVEKLKALVKDLSEEMDRPKGEIKGYYWKKDGEAVCETSGSN